MAAAATSRRFACEDKVRSEINYDLLHTEPYVEGSEIIFFIIGFHCLRKQHGVN